MARSIPPFKKFEDAQIKSVYKPPEAENKVREHVYKRYWQMKNAPERTEQARKWDQWRKQWECWRPPKGRDEWQSNHVTPITISVVETALAEIIDQTPRPLILPRGREDIAKAEIMSLLFDYSWEIANGDTELFNIIKDMLIYGTAIGQEFYWRDMRIIKEVDDDGKEELHEMADFDDPYLEGVKLEDFFPDENARGFDGPYGARDAIRRYLMDIDDFRLFFRGPIWDAMDRAKFVKPGGDTNYYEYYEPPHGLETDRLVEVLWYWSKKPDDALNIVANDVTVKMGPNPHKHKQLPFGRAVDIKRPHSFYGKGEPELLESIQSESDTLRRMLLDRNHLDIDKMFLVSDRITLNDDDLIARPHGMIPTNDVNGVKPVEYGDVPRSVTLGKEWLTEDAIQASGIDPRLEGAPAPGTATEASILKESALKKIRLKMRILEREFLVRIARLRVANIIQFYSDPKLEKVIGDEASNQYQTQIAELKQRNALEVIEGEPYAKTYKNIRLENKEVTDDGKGNLSVKPTEGLTFFEAKPETFVPFAKQGFDVRFAAGATLPVSKALMQSKATEMYDRLIQLALAGVGYDPVKLGDNLLRKNDENPGDYHLKSANVPDEQAGRQDQLIKLATQENQLMMKGEKLSPTAYASPAHTMIHAAFMKSPAYQNIPNDDPRVQNFIDHTIGEMAAQTARGGMSNAPQEEPEDMTQGMPMEELPARPQTMVSPKSNVPGQLNNEKKSILPSLMQGGSEVQR